MKTSKLLLILCFALLQSPPFAHDSNAGSSVGVWYGGSDAKYLLNKTPFIDAPDFSYLLPGGSTIETYRRAPTHCEVCDTFRAPSLRSRNKR